MNSLQTLSAASSGEAPAGRNFPQALEREDNFYEKAFSCGIVGNVDIFFFLM